MKTIGQITAIKQRDKSYSVCLDNSIWYSGFSKCPFQKNDTVEIDFHKSEDGKWNNIETIKAVATAFISHVNSPTINESSKEALMLTSYAKDMYVAFLENGKGEVKASTFVEHLLEMYKKVKEGLDGKQDTNTGQ